MTTRILIVEDEAVTALDLKRELIALGYEVTGIADNYSDAVNAAAAQKPDLVLMDIHLSGSMDGIVAASAIRASEDLPVVFLTAHSDQTTLDRALLASPFGYILKPFQVRELKVTIEVALNKHRKEVENHRLVIELEAALGKAKLLMPVGRQPAAKPAVPAEAGAVPLKFLRGIAGAKGVGLGRAVVFGSFDEEVKPISCPYSREDFERALAATEKQLEALQVRMEERLADVASLIFRAHILMIKDLKFSGAMTAMIESGQSPTAAITHVVEQYSRLFAASKNPRLREKVLDVKDLGRRLLKNLGGGSEEEADFHGRVVIAGEVLPSDILRIAAQKAEGLVLIGGGSTSHIAILARSLQLPMVVADNRDLLALHENSLLLIDGDQGTIYINPADAVLRNYEALKHSEREADALASQIPDVFATRDGVAVDIFANINMLSEAQIALRYKAAGVGLYRSEFPFIVRNDFPSEEEQFRIYRKLIDDMEGRDVTLRTLDVGGDKMLSYFPNANEANPFLGLRAIRFSLRYPDIFVQQLRAMLRAGHERKLNIMFPLVSSVDDFLAAKDVVLECHRQLAKEKTPHCDVPRLGAMIELPAAVEVADELAAEADFLSIGGNDLVQYMLAVDRTNEHIADMYIAHHPAVLRALDRVARAAQRRGKPLSFCGEMATDANMLPFLLGIGIRRVSVESRQIPRVHKIIANLSMAEAAKKSAHLLTLGRISEVAAAMNIARPPAPDFQFHLSAIHG